VKLQEKAACHASDHAGVAKMEVAGGFHTKRITG